MEDLLMICHRIPYPPNKGDKIRSYNFLKYLSKFYRIHLATFVDQVEDERYISNVSQLCESLYVERVNPFYRKLCSITSLLTGQALSIRYYRSKELKSWCEETLKTYRPALVFHMSGQTAQFSEGPAFDGVRKVIDLIDCDSVKWHEYASSSKWPMSWIYKREGELLQKYEVELLKRFHSVIFVSEREASDYKNAVSKLSSQKTRKLGQQSLGFDGHGVDEYGIERQTIEANQDVAQTQCMPVQRVGVVRNGVDTEYFNPEIRFHSIYPSNYKIITFVGAMDYLANEDAVVWFVEHCLANISSRVSNVLFYIVGYRPTKRVRRLLRYKEVRITGYVPDIRPYLQQANVIVAPMRIARGVQNKAL